MSDAAIITEYICDELLDGERVETDTSLFRTKLLDSLSLTSLILFLEQRFAVRIGPMDISYENLDSVSLIVAFLERKRNAAP